MITHCPTDRELEDFLEHASDPVPAGGSSLLSHHIQVCAKCRRRTKSLKEDNALLAEIGGVRSPATLPSDTAVAVRRPAPDAIEGYEILSEIHRGGQGVVYRAIQKATERTVALKVLLRGAFSSVRQLRRFEREIKLSAGLNHPNIVTVFESGVGGDGNRYLAMQHVEGVPLDVHAGKLRESRGDDGRSCLGDLLKTFATICEAVHHAHLQGIVHRDLKPSNILIDAEARPHVLDFGLAKDIDPDALAKASLATLTGEFVGTLAYASPEQTKGDPNLIDVRTDVYSLGVILYELICGRLPYPVTGAMADVLHAIAESDPEPPVTAYGGSHEVPATGKRLSRRPDGDLETIVLKALSKEPPRRYQSAEALRRDIEHYLADEPIDAKRDSRFYVLRKRLNRRKGTITLVSIIASLCAVTLYSVLHTAEVTHLYEATLAGAEQLNATVGAAREPIERPPGDLSHTRPDATVYINCNRGEPAMLNPLRYESTDLIVGELLFERLFWRTAEQDLVPNEHLVAGIEDTDDPRTKIIRLKPDLRWHDGHPLTADDVVFSWEQTVSELVGSGKRAIASQLESVVADDPLTVRFVQKEARPTWRLSINVDLAPKHLFEVKLEEDPSLRKDAYY
ncbi:MAG: protein kinase, partial [Planctomycetota bacterium]|nr:protein kinase [Planctomycetota bacterium]